MRGSIRARRARILSAAVFFLAFFCLEAQTQGYRGPRTADHKPDLNGIWQAMNTANWDIQAHSAAPGRVVALGAEDAEPAGVGVVEGGPLPYLPEALEKKQANYEARLTADPELKCYLPGVPRATYM